MFTLNRLSVVGHMPQNPQIYFVGNNKRVATLTLHTLLEEPNQQGPCKYNVFIDNPDIVEYVDTFVSAGDMVYLEGRLEPIASRNKDHPNHALENWISITEAQSVLFLVHKSSQVLQKRDSSRVDLY